MALPDATTFERAAGTRGSRACSATSTSGATGGDAGAPLPTCVRSNLGRAHAEFRERTGLELRSGTEPEMSWLGPEIEPWWQPNVSRPTTSARSR